MSEPISPRTPQQALAALLARYAPKRLLLVGASRLPAVEAFILQLLAGVRNLNASRVAVLVDLEASDWQETDFFALAMQNSERFQREGQTLTLYTYDLYEYKQVPDWLNAKFWANPENFGKYWW